MTTMSLGKGSAVSSGAAVSRAEGPEKQNEKHVELFRQLYEVLRKRDMGRVRSVLEKINAVAVGDYVNWGKLFDNSYIVDYTVDDDAPKIVIDVFCEIADVRVAVILNEREIVQNAYLYRRV